LTSSREFELANRCHTSLFTDVDGVVRTPVKIEQLLTRKRSEDHGHDLWSTFNVIQEHALKGGIETETVVQDANGTPMLLRRKTQAITAIDRSMMVNKNLFSIGYEMYKELEAE
jgi:hypothetical protein